MIYIWTVTKENIPLNVESAYILPLCVSALSTRCTKVDFFADYSATAKDNAKRKVDLTPQEATYELMQTFRPLCESVGELRRLLEAKADPNAEIPQGRISPLQHVMLFAPAERVAAMRTILLLHGAEETEEDKKRWIQRQDTDANETNYVRLFYEDDREFSPTASAMQR